jgi:VWFA-related protein
MRMMVKTEIGRLKIRGYLSLFFIIALGLGAIAVTGCSGDGVFSGGGSSGDGSNGAPALNVQINQVDLAGCPTIKVYVSVTDQDGNPVLGLTEAEFSLIEDGFLQEFIQVIWAATVSSPISVCMALDYSGSMYDAGAIEAMEAAAIAFVDQMSDDDWGEIIKFSTLVEVVQEFTQDKDLLRSSISDLWAGADQDTALYDAIGQAILDTLSRTGRQAVIAISDGLENKSLDYKTSESIIAYATDSELPVFTIALGDGAETALEEIAEVSGGKYFYAPTADDLEAIYLEISDILENQYIISYDSDLTGGGSYTLQVIVETQELSGSDSIQFTACPAP